MASVKLSEKAVGSILKLNVNGSPKNFIVVHQGKPSSLYDDSCNGTWVLMQDIYNQREWDNPIPVSTIRRSAPQQLAQFERNARGWSLKYDERTPTDLSVPEYDAPDEYEYPYFAANLR